MLPCKVFLEAIKGQDPNIQLKVQLLLNGLFYDQIKQFHTKYFCLTAVDQLSVQVIRADSNQLLGCVKVPQAYKLAIQKKSIQLQLKRKNIDLLLIFNFEPVLRLQKNCSPIKHKEDMMGLMSSAIQTSPFRANQLSTHRQSNRQPFRQTQRQVFQPGMTNRSVEDAGSGFQLKSRIQEMLTVQNDSLESLALQREKILGELFGKFKKAF